MSKPNKLLTEEVGEDIYDLIKQLYPICRSITGGGVRKTLKIVKRHIPLNIHEVPSGTKVFDWIVPKEWMIKDAYIKNSHGEKIIDFRQSNLHVLNYSSPIHRKMKLKELKKHLFTLPDYPDTIPYVTSYYKENWGFCLTQKQYDTLKDSTYGALIDSSLKRGYLTYGEFFIKGKSKEEILFTTYTCHPSLCNDNLSGVALLTFLAKYIKGMNSKYSYRFLFIPETIGAITWLSINENKISNIKCGLVSTCVGDSGKLTYKRTRSGTAIIDKIVEKVLIDSGEPYEIIDFNPADGSDERHFCSPGINLAIGSLMRTPYGRFSEYHTSADDLNFVGAKYLGNSLARYLDVIFILENNGTYLNLYPKGEPQLGRRGLYRAVGYRGLSLNESAIFWVLNFSDTNNSLLDIAFRSGFSFRDIKCAADALLKKGLLKIVSI